MILKQYNSKSTRYKIPPGVYTFKDLSLVPSRCFKNEFAIRGRMRPNFKYDSHDSIIIASDNVTLITKIDLRPDIKVLRFDRKSFFNTIFLVLGFSPYWDYKNLIGHDDNE